MFVQRISRRFNSALRQGVAYGVVPFDWGAIRLREDLRQAARRGHSPATFTDKVRFKLIRDRRPIARLYADKLAVRDYVRHFAPTVRLPNLLGVFARESDVVDGIPQEPWVMKGTHGSGMVLISSSRGSVPKTVVQRAVRDWLQTDYALRYWEWQYFRLPKRVMFEEYLGDGQNTPNDYKFYVMHQQVRFIEVDQARFTGHTRDFFRPDWTPIISRIGPAPVASVTPRCPAQLGRMIGIAEALARETDFLRVDLYAVRGEIYFGELTHSPAAGNFGFEDPTLDAQLGSYWRVPTEYR